MVPSLSAQNLESIKIGKDFMFSHGYIKNDFDVDEWARPEFLEKAVEEVLKEEWAAGAGASSPRAAGSRSKARGSGDGHKRGGGGTPPAPCPQPLPSGNFRARRVTQRGRRRAGGLRPSHQRDRSTHVLSLFVAVPARAARRDRHLVDHAQPGRWDARLQQLALAGDRLPHRAVDDADVGHRARPAACTAWTGSGSDSPVALDVATWSGGAKSGVDRRSASSASTV